MAKLSTAARQKLPSSSFALPGKGTGKGGKGSGSYPIPDPSHARNALSRVSAHGTPSEKATVRAKVHKKFPSIGKKQFGGTVTPKLGGSMTPRLPKAPTLMGAPRAPRPKPLAPRVPGRLSSTAGMKSGGVKGYRHGGVVRGSGDPKPATCGNLSGPKGGVGPFK